MKIKYAGPKVIFTRHGVDFDNNKDDKYTYINIAIQLHKAFEHEYNEGEIYVYDGSSKRLNDDDMMEFIVKKFPSHEHLIEEARQKANGYFQHEKEKVENQKDLLDIVEYNTWLKNIELMKDYVLQRHFNKNMYYFLVQEVSTLIKKHSIKQVHLPMYQNFIHVLHSIQGALKLVPNPKSSKININEKEGNLIAILEID